MINKKDLREIVLMLSAMLIGGLVLFMVIMAGMRILIWWWELLGLGA